MQRQLYDAFCLNKDLAVKWLLTIIIIFASNGSVKPTGVGEIVSFSLPPVWLATKENTRIIIVASPHVLHSSNSEMHPIVLDVLRDQSVFFTEYPFPEAEIVHESIDESDLWVKRGLNVRISNLTNEFRTRALDLYERDVLEKSQLDELIFGHALTAALSTAGRIRNYAMRDDLKSKELFAQFRRGWDHQLLMAAKRGSVKIAQLQPDVLPYLLYSRNCDDEFTNSKLLNLMLNEQLDFSGNLEKSVAKIGELTSSGDLKSVIGYIDSNSSMRETTEIHQRCFAVGLNNHWAARIGSMVNEGNLGRRSMVVAGVTHFLPTTHGDTLIESMRLMGFHVISTTWFTLASQMQK